MFSLRKLIYTVITFYFVMNAIGAEGYVDLSCDENDKLSCATFMHSSMTSWCVNGTCFCGNPVSGQVVKCIPVELMNVQIIGGYCPCNISNSYCYSPEYLCYCKEDYMPSQNRRECIPVSARLGEKCEQDVQCQYYSQPFMHCHREKKICVCNKSYIEFDGYCLARLAKSCKTDRDCNYCGYAICLQDPLSPGKKRCACDSTGARDKYYDKCNMASYSKSSCTQDASCQRRLGVGGVCNKVCECKPGYYLADHKNGFKLPQHISKQQWSGPLSICMREPVIGTYCRFDAECEILNKPKADQIMSCVFGECACVHGYSTLDHIHCVLDEKPLELQLVRIKDSGTAIHIAMVIIILAILIFLLGFLLTKDIQF